MDTSNELYSSLSRLSQHTVSMLTEVPKIVSIFNISCKLVQYSASYSGTIHDCCTIEMYDDCTSLVNAMQS